MSKRALFKNAFQQIRRLWKSAVNLEERVITLEHRIYDDDDGIVRRVNALEDVAHTPSEAECRALDFTPEEMGLEAPYEGQTVAELIHEVAIDQALGVIRRNDTEKVITGIIERRIEAAKSAPEPTSEGLWARKDDGFNIGTYYYDKATPAQVRQAAVDAGLLDTPRQKVAEAFLHALCGAGDANGWERPYKDNAEYLHAIAKAVNVACWGNDLHRMAAVLEAAKGEQ